MILSETGLRTRQKNKNVGIFLKPGADRSRATLFYRQHILIIPLNVKGCDIAAPSLDRILIAVGNFPIRFNRSVVVTFTPPDVG